MTQQLLPTRFDTSAMNTEVRPQDDLYRYINGTWLEEHVIPDDKAIDGLFNTLRDESEKHRKDLIEACMEGEVTQDKASEIAQLYQAFMDTAAVEAQGLQPLIEELDALHHARDKHELTELLGRWTRTNDNPLPAAGISIDPNNPDRYVFFLSQGGLGLPDESYYHEEAYAPVRHAYVAFIAELLERAETHHQFFADRDAAELAQAIMDFETKIAHTHWDSVTMRDTDKTNNPMSWEDMKKLGPDFEWDTWLEGSGLSAEDLNGIVVSVPDHISGWATLWTDTDIDTIKAWMRFHYVSAYAPLLSDEFVTCRFNFFGRVLTGTEEIRPRWKRGVGVVESHLGEPLGRIYVGKYFPAENKSAMENLVDHLLGAYRESITDLDWMGEDTKQRALEKLSKFVYKIGYPDKWRDYSALSFDDDDTLVTMTRKVALFEHDYELSRLTKPVDRDEWHMTPQTVNAYYNPTQNEIVFPAAILQHPFFDIDAPLAQNYGAIGAVIGHEIGHGFDDQGAKFDGDGKINNWWSDDDEKEFSQRTQALIDYYSAFSPRQLDDEYKVNGALTIGENIGDLGGLTIAYQAWLKAMKDAGKDVTKEDQQLFFYSWAYVWRTKVRDELAIQLLAVDPHSPAEFRCNAVVSHSDAFAEAFELKESDELWLDPDKRVRIW